MRGSTTNRWQRALVAGSVALVFVCGIAYLALGNGESIMSSEAGSGSRNISWFVFRDINRAGVYGMADRPYVGFPVVLEAADGSEARRVSNIDGHANFRMSRDARQGVINEPGEHALHARVPPGWQVTSAVCTETLHFAERAHAPAGLIAARTPAPLGVAPLPRMEGQIPGRPGCCSLLAIGPGGAEHDVRVREDGTFRLEGAPGQRRLVLSNPARGNLLHRSVTLGHHTRVLPPSFFTAEQREAVGGCLVVDYDALIRTPRRLQDSRRLSGPADELRIASDNNWHVILDDSRFRRPLAEGGR